MVIECPNGERHTHQGWTQAELDADVLICTKKLAARLVAPPTPETPMTVEQATAMGDIPQMKPTKAPADAGKVLHHVIETTQGAGLAPTAPEEA